MASLSHQAIASIAAKYNCSFQETAQKLAGFFKVTFGVDYVFDITLARHLSLLESAREFINVWKNSDRKWPILNSVCPGWVCYIEKTHGPLVPYLSRVKSPQQIMGSLIKQVWQEKNGHSSVYHLSLMPCFDKKLEASREYFMHKETSEKDVDCVLTPIEIEQLFQVKQLTFEQLPSCDLDILNDKFSSDTQITSHRGSGSGGYAENVLLLAVSELFPLNQLPKLNFTTRRNRDFQEITVAQETGCNGGKPLKFAIVNGFRNIQTLVQMIKRNKCEYQFVEVMACPGGCLNGGAQVRPSEITQESFMEKVNLIYSSLQLTNIALKLNDEPSLAIVWSELLQDKKDQLLFTQFKEVPKTSNLLSLKW